MSLVAPRRKREFKVTKNPQIALRECDIVGLDKKGTQRSPGAYMNGTGERCDIIREPLEQRIANL